MAKTVVVSGFDPFDGGSDNNSTVIAKKLVREFKNKDINIVFCPLETVYFKASESLKDCISSLKVKPDFVLSLGEANCREVKFETRAINWMKDISHDNDGVHYTGEEIRPEEDRFTPMTLDLVPIKKKLKYSHRKYIKISKNAGTFVCNNTAFIMSRDLEMPYAFIHVPKHNCRKSAMLVERSTKILVKTIESLFN